MKKKILIVMANYYEQVSDGLLNSAKKRLPKPINLIKVPGVFEIPVIIAKNIKKYDAFIALGCVIKGQTPHFDFISSAVTKGIMDISITHKKPIGYGILTCLNEKQALERSNPKQKKLGKGGEAAEAVIKILQNT